MTMNYFVSCLLMSFIGYSFGAEYMKTKAEYLKTCQIKDPEFKACSTESIQILFSRLAKGIMGLELKFDPMKLRKTQIVGDDGPVSINTTLTKSVIIGLSNTVVIESYVSPIDYSWITKYYLPKLRIEGNYQMQGRILVLPLNGRGNCWIETNGMDLTIDTKTHLYEKFDHIFYNITGVRADFKITGLQLRFNNPFDGIKVLEDSTNQYLNENWRPVSESLKPVIAKAIENTFFETQNTIFNFIPADYFVSDIPHPSELYGS